LETSLSLSSKQYKHSITSISKNAREGKRIKKLSLLNLIKRVIKTKIKQIESLFTNNMMKKYKLKWEIRRLKFSKIYKIIQ